MGWKVSVKVRVGRQWVGARSRRSSSARMMGAKCAAVARLAGPMRQSTMALGRPRASGVVGEADAVFGGGMLLDVDVEADGGAAADGAAVFEAGVEEEAGDVGCAAEHGEEIFAEGFTELAALERAEEIADGGGAGVFGLFDGDVGHDGGEVLAGAQLRTGFELAGEECAVDEEGAEAFEDVFALRESRSRRRRSEMWSWK